MIDRKKLGVYLVTDSDLLEGRDFYECMEAALQGGVTTLQLREKDCSGKEFLEKAKVLREMTQKYDAWFIINDRVDIALLVDADGVHVGQSDIPVADVRRLIGPHKILGISAKTVEQAVKGKEDGADYLGVGAMFPTTTKADAEHVSMETLQEIDATVNLPKVVIGGITLENKQQFDDCNVDGFAVVSAILKVEDIKAEVSKWL